jgi:2-dehydropantoate 2-reductase
MGQIEDLNERVFTDKARRPTYMFGIMRHGVYLRSPTEAILSGLNGRAAIGVVESEEDASSTRANPQYLLDTLLQSPILRCEELAWKELLQNQLFKLAANCVLNPLTAILDVRNGVIKENLDLQPLIQRLLQEISSVFQNLPEIKDLPSDQKDQFSVPSLKARVMDTIEKTAGNSSSMREDVRKGRATEIEYINGWILRRARELGIGCEANAGLMQLVLAKSRLTMGNQG